MMKVEVSGEPLQTSPYAQQLKQYELNRRLFRREFRQLRVEFPCGRGWVQALNYYQVFWERKGEYRLGLPTMYLPDELPAKSKYGKYLLCVTIFPSYEQAAAIAEEIKKTMARPESLTMDFKMGEQSALIPSAPWRTVSKGQ